MYVLLCDSDLNIVYKYNPPNNYVYGNGNGGDGNGDGDWGVLMGFSDTHKKMYICWIYGSVYRMQIYSLTNDIGTIVS